jgi:hypothetical protein
MADETIKGMSTTDKPAPAEKPAEQPAPKAEEATPIADALEAALAETKDDDAARARAEYLRAWPLEATEKR